MQKRKKEKPCIFAGTKPRMKKVMKEYGFNSKTHKITLLKKTDKNYDIDKKKGKYCIRKK